MIGFCRSLIDALHARYGDSYILEPEYGQEIRDIYTETHFALANLLLYLLDGKQKDRLKIAAVHLDLYKKLKTETPFNNFAVNLALALCRMEKVEHPLVPLLDELCRGQTLDRDQVRGSRCGNNMVFMQVLNDLVVRPRALEAEAKSGSVEELLSELEFFRNADGLYFDRPRSGEEPRLCPPAYCLKFLFLLHVGHVLRPDRALEDAFLRGARAAVRLMTREGDFACFGRSDHTVFATGLAVYVLRAAALLGEGTAGLCRRQEDRLMETPRMPGGWLGVNQCAPSNPWPRDPYAYPSEYTAAAATYVLLSLLLAKGRPPPPPVEAERLHFALARETGLARLEAGEYEAVLRIKTQPEAMDRRYLGPTVVHLSRGKRRLVGAVPLLAEGDYLVRSREKPKWKKLLLRFLLGFSSGIEPLAGHRAGFVPAILDGPSIYLPARLLGLRGCSARYSMDCFLQRGLRPALHLLNSLIWVNLKAGYLEKPYLRREGSPFRLERVATIDRRGLVLKDRLEGPLKGKKLLIGVRCFEGADIQVEGLIRRSQETIYASDGPSLLTLYGTQALGNSIEYTIAVR